MKTNQSVVQQSSGDFTLTGCGSVSLFHPHTKSAQDWLHRHCPPSSNHQYYGDALAIEHRFAPNIIGRAMDAGLLKMDFSSNESTLSKEGSAI